MKNTVGKKIVYIFIAALLGLILSFIAHAIIEIIYLDWLTRTGQDITWPEFFGHSGCALPIWLQVLLPILGIAGGLWIGFWGYKKVYENKK
ncbi:hypothetical protein ACFL2B_03275 [Patescibacteria group bacterium]